MTEAVSQGASAPSAIGESGSSQSTASGKRVYVPEHKQQPAKADPPQQAPTFKGTKHRIKVDGQEAEVDYDDLVGGYQKAQSSARRFQEANRLANQSQEVLKKLEQGDIGFLVEKLGAQKAKDLFEQYLINDMEHEALPEAEKRARRLEGENKKLLSEKQQFEQWKAEQEKGSYLEKAHKEIDDSIAEALTKLGRKPTPRVVLRIVDDMIARMGDDSEGWDADTAAKAAIGSIHRDITDYLSDMPAAELVKILPESVLKTIRQHEVAQVMDKKSTIRVKAEKQGQAPVKKKTIADAFKDIETRFAR